MTPPTPHGVLRWACAALAVSVLLTAAKLGVWRQTGSTAVLSDALESLVNIATSAFSLWTIRQSLRPRDDDHPYGHGRVEYLSAGVEGALVAVAAVTIGLLAVRALADPPPLGSPDLGAGLVALIALVTWVAGQRIEAAGQRFESPSLTSDGAHLRADAVTTLGAFAGLLGVALTRWAWLDPLVALILSLWLFRLGTGILRRAVGGLLDEAVPGLLARIARTLEAARAPGWSAPHHVKVHRLGQTIHIDMHLVLPRFWDLERAHDASLAIDAALRDEFGEGTDIMTHLEPCTPAACQGCDLEPCPVRAHPARGRVPWTADTIRQPFRHGPRDVTG